MSKKKNTLKDLDEFLKQQAATLVSPDRLRDKKEITPPAGEKKAVDDPGLSVNTVAADLMKLSKKHGSQFRPQFYDLIVHLLEAQEHALPEDKMLINTALYLKSGDRWKEAISEYWKGRS